MSCQLVMGLTLLPIAFLDYRADLSLLYLLLPMHAAAAATQDVAIDAWAIRITPEQERGRITAAMQMGMLSGRWQFGAGVLIAGEALGDGIVIAALVGVVWATSLLVMLSGDPAPQGASAERWRVFFSSLKRVFSARNTWLGLGLAGLGGAGFEAVGAVLGPFLIDRGFSSTAVGHVYTGSVATMLAGAVAGGWAADRFGRRSSTASFLVFLAVVIAALAGMDAVTASVSRTFLVTLLLAVYLGIGLFTAASYALFMDLTDARLAGTQFSAYMGATNACESWSAFTAGRLVAASGYPLAFATMAGLSLLALPLLALTSLPAVVAKPGTVPEQETRSASGQANGRS
jgi:MFS family permease